MYKGQMNCYDIIWMYMTRNWRKGIISWNYVHFYHLKGNAWKVDPHKDLSSQYNIPCGARQGTFGRFMPHTLGGNTAQREVKVSWNSLDYLYADIIAQIWNFLFFFSSFLNRIFLVMPDVAKRPSPRWLHNGLRP